MGRPAPRSQLRKARQAAASGGRAENASHLQVDEGGLKHPLGSGHLHALDPVAPQADRSGRTRPVLPADEAALHHECVKLTEERLPLGIAYPRFLDVVHRVIPFDHGTLYLAEGPAGALIPTAIRGSRVDLADQVRFAKGTGLSAWVAQEGRPVIIPHPVQSTDPAPFADKGLRAFLALPLIRRGGVTGVLALARAEEMFSVEEFDHLVNAGERLASTLFRLRLQSRYREWMRSDPETGLSAPHHFCARLEAELARAHDHATEFSVVVMALEGLEVGVPLLGVQGQKRLLRGIAERLQNGIRSCDMAALLDDGKFGILLAGVNRDLAGAILQRIATTVLSTPELPPGEHVIRLQGGVAAFPEAGTSVDDLVEQARSGLKLIA